MNRINNNDKNYDAWLHWSPTNKCNLNCVYCIAQSSKKTEEISKINISTLIKTLNETDRTFNICFTGGGEPFLIPNIIESCMEITKNHFISFNTNLTSEKVKEFTNRLNSERVLYIIASFHVKELERRDLLDKYISNFHLCKEKGFNISAYMVAFPPLLTKIEEYKKFFLEKGIELKFNPFIGEFDGKKYPFAYKNKELKILGLKMKDLTIFRQRGSLCNAGYNFGIVSPDGEVHYCYEIHNSIGNIYDRITFSDKITRCNFKFCGFPLKIYDSYLFEKIIKNLNSNSLRPIFLEKFILYFKNLLEKCIPNKNINQIFKFLIKIENFSYDFYVFLKKISLNDFKNIKYRIRPNFIKYNSIISPDYKIPEVSCLLITKNRFKLVKRAINCWLKQSFKNTELVIVEDGEDETQNFIKSLIKKHPQIRYFRPIKRYNLGQLRNLSLKLAKGKYVINWDDDDFSHSKRVEVQLEAIIKKKASLCLLSRGTIAMLPSNEFGYGPKIRMINTVLAKRSDIPYYSEQEKGEDSYMLSEATRKRLKIVKVDRPDLYIYIFHGNNTWDEKHLMGILKRGLIFRNDNPMISEIKKLIEC